MCNEICGGILQAGFFIGAIIAGTVMAFLVLKVIFSSVPNAISALVLAIAGGCYMLGYWPTLKPGAWLAVGVLAIALPISMVARTLGLIDDQ
jgi:hypothetical protein